MFYFVKLNSVKFSYFNLLIPEYLFPYNVLLDVKHYREDLAFGVYKGVFMSIIYWHTGSYRDN